MTKPNLDSAKESTFLSFVLRHKPNAIGLKLDQYGWADIDELIAKSNQYGEITALNRELIELIVENNDKKRFALSDDGKYIRANQGHSIEVDLQLIPKQPPNTLYHGTATRFLESIRAQGLIPRQRKHVHLSEDTDTARLVGKRYGKPIVLAIDAKAMHQQGHNFFLTENDVWLANVVPPEFINER